MGELGPWPGPRRLAGRWGGAACGRGLGAWGQRPQPSCGAVKCHKTLLSQIQTLTKTITPTNPKPRAARWARFAGVSVPWLTKLANAFISGQLEARQAELARDAVDNVGRLGPTFVKLLQILSIRWGRGRLWLGVGAAGARVWGLGKLLHANPEHQVGREVAAGRLGPTVGRLLGAFPPTFSPPVDPPATAAPRTKPPPLPNGRPDVLPPPVMAELSRVQDQMQPFSTEEARAMIEKVRAWASFWGLVGGRKGCGGRPLPDAPRGKPNRRRTSMVCLVLQAVNIQNQNPKRQTPNLRILKLCAPQELGRPISEVFTEFGAEPVGAASLAQVGGAAVTQLAGALCPACLVAWWWTLAVGSAGQGP